MQAAGIILERVVIVIPFCPRHSTLKMLLGGVA